MRGDRLLGSLLHAVAAACLVLAAVVAGYAARPSQADAAFDTYLALGGDPAGLCGGAPHHGGPHCDGCQLGAPALAGAAANLLPARADGWQAASFILRDDVTLWQHWPAAPPRGPPGHRQLRRHTLPVTG